MSTPASRDTQKEKLIASYMAWGVTREQAEQAIELNKPLSFHILRDALRQRLEHREDHAIAAKVSPSAKATD